MNIFFVTYGVDVVLSIFDADLGLSIGFDLILYGFSFSFLFRCIFNISLHVSP